MHYSAKFFNRLAACLLVAVIFPACSLNPDKRKMNYLKDGERYVKSGRYQDAIVQFQRALEIDPKFSGGPLCAWHYLHGIEKSQMPPTVN